MDAITHINNRLSLLLLLARDGRESLAERLTRAGSHYRLVSSRRVSLATCVVMAEFRPILAAAGCRQDRDSSSCNGTRPLVLSRLESCIGCKCVLLCGLAVQQLAF